MPTLTVQAPTADVTVPPGQQLRVVGVATGTGGAEPVLVDSVEVSVDGGAAVAAHLTVVTHQHVPTVTFVVAVDVPEQPGAHTVSVVATDDNGRTATRSVEVLRAVTVVVPPPAILIDLEPPGAVAVDGPTVSALVSSVQQVLAERAGALAAAGLLLAGPTVLATEDAAGIPILRFGIWLVDGAFPVVPASPPQFPLPRLSDVQAQVGFALVPPLPRGHRTGFTDTPFGIRIPGTTLQELLNVAVAQANNGDVESVTASLSAPATVVTAVRGSHLGIGFEIDVTETLSVAAVTDGPVPQSVPHVDTSYDTSVGGLLDWLLGAVVPLLDGVLLFASVELAQNADQVPGVVSALLAGLPARVPFRNTSLPPVAAGQFAFPEIVLDWTSFGVADGAVTGAGNALLVERDQAGARLAVAGPGSLRIPAGESDVALAYQLELAGLRPDAGGLTWQLHAPTGVADSGAADPGVLSREADVALDFLLPAHTAAATFTITAAAVETCGTDPVRKLTGSASRVVQVSRPTHVPL